LERIAAEDRQLCLDATIDAICAIFRFNMTENRRRRLLADLLDGKQDLPIHVDGVGSVIDNTLASRARCVEIKGVMPHLRHLPAQCGTPGAEPRKVI
jgi:hypothetical protein